MVVVSSCIVCAGEALVYRYEDVFAGGVGVVFVIYAGYCVDSGHGCETEKH